MFRQEIGATTRSASPFLISLAASQGRSLDELVGRIEPKDGWPRSPSLSRTVGFEPVGNSPRRFLVSTASGWVTSARLRGFGHRLSFMQSGDDWAHLEVVNHSLEVEARIGPMWLETLYGTLRIELDFRLPGTLAAACVGRQVGDVVDHASLRNRDWLITAIDDPCLPHLGQSLFVGTGSTPYRMPWVRAGPSSRIAWSGSLPARAE